MFGVPVKDMPAEVRRRAKAINFGIIYGISAFGLANQLGIEREEAGAYIKKYFERFPGIRDYMDETREFCRENGYVLTLFGRKCHYPDIKASNPSIRSFNERAAINARLQGSAADIIRRAMMRMEPALAKAKLNAQMLLQVHDELIFEVPEGEVDRDHADRQKRDGGRAAPGGVAARAAAGRRPRRRQLGRGALDLSFRDGPKGRTRNRYSAAPGLSIPGSLALLAPRNDGASMRSSPACDAFQKIERAGARGCGRGFVVGRPHRRWRRRGRPRRYTFRPTETPCAPASMISGVELGSVLPKWNSSAHFGFRSR